MKQPLRQAEDEAVARGNSCIELESANLPSRQPTPDASRLALVASLTDEAVVMTDAQGRIQWVNDAFVRMCEYTLPEVIGRKPGSFLQGPETDPLEVARIRRYLADGKRVTSELVNYRKSGQTFWQRMDIYPIRSDGATGNGIIDGFVAIETDTTAERRQAADLERQSTRLQLATEAAGIGVWEVYRASRTLSCDDEVRHILGVEHTATEPESFRTQDWLAHVHPEDREAIQEQFLRLTGNPGRFDIPFRICRADGSVRHIRTRGLASTERLLGVLIDETASVEQREALRIAEERLRIAASAIQMGLWEAGPHGPQVWDDGMLRIYGIDRQEFAALMALPEAGALWKKYLHPDDLQRALLEMETALDRGRRIDVQYRIVPPDGETRHLRSAGIVIGESRDSRRAVGITMDVTPENGAAEKLRAAKDEAEAASRAKGHFLATMSHEIRTPLNGVIGLANLLADTPLNATQQDYLNTILSSGESLLAIVNDILDFSKIEEGRLALEQTGFDLRELVEDVIELVAEPARAKGLGLHIAIDTGRNTNVTGDPVRLRQVLLNLLSNAVKFTPSGSVTLQVQSKPGGGPCDYRFEIVDSGIGITEQDRHNLFRPFSQADSSITRRFGGTGLGLAISDQLVRLMGGSIGVESEPGAGSTFWFTASLAAGSGASASETPPAAFKGRSALIVDGDAGHRTALRESLEQIGLRVSVVSNALEAISQCSTAAVAGQPFSVLFINPEMPVMDGWKLTKVLRGQKGGAGLAIFMVARRHLPAAWQGGSSGHDLVDGWLIKPVPRRQLIRALQKVLEPNHLDAGATPLAKPAATSPGRILLVEDNRVNQVVVKAMLEKLGYRVDIASDGLQAIEAVGRSPYDTILMDCHMPRMDGFAATTAIRQMEQGRRRTPIVALTADVLETDRKRCLEGDMDDFLTKPLDGKTLESTLTRWAAYGGVPRC